MNNDDHETFTNYTYCPKLLEADVTPDARRWIAMYALDIVHMLTKEYNDGRHELNNLMHKADRTSESMAYFNDQCARYVPNLTASDTVDLLHAQIGHYATNLLQMERDWAGEMATLNSKKALHEQNGYGLTEQDKDLTERLKQALKGKVYLLDPFAERKDGVLYLRVVDAGPQKIELIVKEIRTRIGKVEPGEIILENGLMTKARMSGTSVEVEKHDIATYGLDRTPG